MNGYPAGSGPYGQEGSRLSPPAPTADGKSILQAYRKDIITGFEKEAPRFNPMNPERTQSSAMVDLKDPIQVHLLTETALTDSKEYEVLSQEEVDELKKQAQYLSQRIESTRSNLLIQEKYRNAAISMAKLYSPGKSEGKRRSLLGNRLSGDQNAKDAEAEKKACERKCEELAAELFSLEKRLMEPHRRLLEHTAGILQLTHKVSKRKNTPQHGQVINGIPGSPESLYTYSHSRNSLDNEAYLDETNFYQLDGIDGSKRKNAIEIPQKSPIREQTNQLREEIDRVREENKELLKSVSETEQRLESLNGALRETIVRFNPSINNDYDLPPRTSGAQGPDAVNTLRSQVDYLESGLVAVQAEQQSFSGGKETGSRIESLNLQLRDLLMSANHHFEPSPIPSESDVDGQLAYLEDAIGMVDSELARATSSKGLGNEDTEAALTGLWGTIQSGFADIKQRKDERRRTRAERGLEDDDDMSDDDGLDTAEAYSLSAFTTRVHWLYRQATTLKDQKSVLKRQIKQQRELNNKSDAEKDEEIERKQAEVDQSRELVDRAEKDAMDAQTMLSEALSDLEKAREAAGSGTAAQAQLEESNAKVDFLEGKLKEFESKLSAAESGSKDAGNKMAEVDRTISTLTSKLEAATKAKEKAEEKASSLKSELDQQQEEMEQLNMTYAETKTELTIAQAELDGAYGTRAERAADVAAVKNSAEVVRLGNQVEKLKKELSGTVKDLEEITKESIGSEREKNELEDKLNDALTAKASLETEVGGMNEKFEAQTQKLRDMIAKLHEELDGERLKAGPGGSKASAGATMLSEQFRATMRGERKKFQEDLKEERARCRRLEDELSRLKRAAGPGKSPLSPR